MGSQAMFSLKRDVYKRQIDDLSGKTLAAASSLGMAEQVAKKEQAAKVG